jgi:hypothetical protein
MSVVVNRIALFIQIVTGISLCIPVYARLPLHHNAGGGTKVCSIKIDPADCFSQKNNG